MVNHNNLNPGARIVYVREDPHRGNYAIPRYCLGTAGTVDEAKLHDLRRPDVKSYGVRFDCGESWWVLSTMLDLEEGPW